MTLLDVHDINFSYRSKQNVLKDVSFTVNEGDILCLLGSNGTGKTTLLRCLLGLEKIETGEIWGGSEELTHLSTKQRAHFMAYVPQSSTMTFSYLAYDVVLMGRVSHLAPGATYSQKDRDAAIHAMEELKIRHLSSRRFQELSGGERQMVLVARALAQESRVIVMDEPTANLDYHNQICILKAILRLSHRGFGILMTSHYPDHAFLACSSVALMKNGTIVDSGDPNLVVTSSSLSELYDSEVRVVPVEINGSSTKVCIPLLKDRDESDLDGKRRTCN